MKQCCYYGLLVCASLIIGGCASQPPRQTSDAIVGATGPEIHLPGPGVEQARLLAMGMAQSKGWRIVEAAEHRLLLERNLPPDSPQARMLNPEGHPSTPRLQVETRLSERGRDVLVGLNASVVIYPGTERERRIDYTDDYEDALLLSLNALASAWLENRTRIASKIPQLPDPDTVVIAEASTNALPESPTEPAQAAPIEAETAAAHTNADAPASAPAQASSVRLEQPTLRRPAGRIRDEFTDAEASETNDINEMLVLDNVSPRGLWTFYAEASARERGCHPDARGAVMLKATPALEFYEVQCTDGNRLMLSCQGGVCRARP